MGRVVIMLPTPLSYLSKTLRLLKSSLTPNQIAVSLSLGLFAGLPPLGLHIIIPCSVALLFRCSFRGFLFALGLFKLLSLPLAPASFALGRFLLAESRGLDPLWRWIVHQPVFAPMGYQRYLLLGSLVIAVGLAVPLFFAVRILVIRYRESFSMRVSGWRISQKLRTVPGASIARRFLLGGEAKYIEAKRPWGPFRWIRKEMLLGLPVIYALCYLLAAALVPLFAGGLATSTASWVAGAEVAVQESAFSLLTGRLILTELIVQDPKAPSENLVEIPSLTLDAGMWPLLSKRVVFNEVRIEEASLHVVREEDGTLNLDNAGSGWNVDGYVAWATEHAKDVDWLGLLRRFVQYLSETRPLRPRVDPYAQWKGGRSFEPFTPPFTVERIAVGSVRIRLEDRYRSTRGLPPLTLFEVELHNLAFPSSLSEEPVTLVFRGRFGDEDGSGFELSAQFLSHNGQPRRMYAFEARRVDLAALAAAYETTLPVEIPSGFATLEGSLVQEGDTASGSVSLVLEGLSVAGREGRTLFELDPQLSARLLDGWNRYAASLPIVLGFDISGGADRPQFEWEAALLEVARQGLLMAGTRELAAAAEQLGLRIDALGGVPDIPLDGDYEALRTTAGQAAVDLIRDAVPGVPAEGGEGTIDALLKLLQSR